MAIKIINCKISNIESDKDLRVDPKFYFFNNSKYNWNVFQSDKNLVKLKELIKENYTVFELEDGKEYKGIPTGEAFIDQDGEIIDFQNVNNENCPNRIKYKIKKEDIILSSLRLAKSPASSFENLENLNEYIFSNGFYIFQINNKWNKKFLIHLLRSKKIKKIIDENIYRGIGISAYKFSDLEKIMIPNININIQNKIVEKINIIEKNIKRIKADIIEEKDLINQIFYKTFNYDLKKYQKLKKIKIYNLDFNNFSNNIDIRNSVKFHRPSGKHIIKDLKRINTKKIKDFISEKIVLGKTISPNDFYEDGNFFYVSMADIKKWKFDKSNAKKVSNNYSEKNYKQSVRKNDLIIARSGEGTIGKLALIDQNDLNGIFSDFTIRIRLKNYNIKFAYYYFRSFYFQELIEINKKGLGNNTNIFPNQLMEFPIIDISVEKQKKIVKEIEEKLKDQKILNEKLDFERAKIDELVSKTFYN